MEKKMQPWKEKIGMHKKITCSDTKKSSKKLYNNKKTDSIRVYALMNPKEIVVLTQTSIQL